VDVFGIETWEPEETLAPDYNVAPTKEVHVVLDRPLKDADDKRPVRQLRTLRWGLVPSWAKSPEGAARMINARAETVHEKPSYRRAFAARRCIVPADGYYEWMVAEDGKHPMYLHGDGVLGFAGLYEHWRDPDDQWLSTYTILTCTATDELGHIHDRSPVLVPPELRDDWLDPTTTDLAFVRDLIASMPPPRLHAYEVSTLVNSVRNNGAGLIEPIG
jgi:putative SOS response-associated peptidase YedK